MNSIIGGILKVGLDDSSDAKTIQFIYSSCLINRFEPSDVIGDSSKEKFTVRENLGFEHTFSSQHIWLEPCYHPKLFIDRTMVVAAGLSSTWNFRDLGQIHCSPVSY